MILPPATWAPSGGQCSACLACEGCLKLLCELPTWNSGHEQKIFNFQSASTYCSSLSPHSALILSRFPHLDPRPGRTGIAWACGRAYLFVFGVKGKALRMLSHRISIPFHVQYILSHGLCVPFNSLIDIQPVDLWEGSTADARQHGCLKSSSEEIERFKSNPTGHRGFLIFVENNLGTKCAFQFCPRL